MFQQVQRAVSGGSICTSVLATSPRVFRHCGGLQYGMPSNFPYTMTNHGLQIHLPLVPVYPSEDTVHLIREEPDGWIGLLNCKMDLNGWLVGIILSPSTNSSTGSLARAEYGDPPNHTVLVDARYAALAILKNVTIIQNFGNSAWNDSLLNPDWQITHQIVVNCDQIEWMDYKIKAVASVNKQRWIHDYGQAWNQASCVLSIGYSLPSDELYVFNFISDQDFPEFSVVVKVSSDRLGEPVSAILWNRPLSSSDVPEQLSLFPRVGNSSEALEGVVERIIVVSDSEEWQINVVIMDKRVLDHKFFIVDFNVHAHGVDRRPQ
jgi:hypothetical protein